MSYFVEILKRIFGEREKENEVLQPVLGHRLPSQIPAASQSTYRHPVSERNYTPDLTTNTNTATTGGNFGVVFSSSSSDSPASPSLPLRSKSSSIQKTASTAQESYASPRRPPPSVTSLSTSTTTLSSSRRLPSPVSSLPTSSTTKTWPSLPPQASNISSPAITSSSASPPVRRPTASLSSPQLSNTTLSSLATPMTPRQASASTNQPVKSSLVVKLRPDHQRYEIPKDLEEDFQNYIVPAILRRPLSPSTYADYFVALLHSEDFYVEKWSNFLLRGVTLEFHEGAVSFNSQKTKKTNKNVLNEEKKFVAFEINEVPERRPYLLSRDFVFARPAAELDKVFKGVIYRVVKSTTVLVEFGDDFHAQHSLSERYDVSFSFNRVCLKRCHQAVSAVKDHVLNDILFPKSSSDSSSLKLQPNLIHTYMNIAGRILNHKGPLPYLIEGPLSTIYDTSAHSTVPVKLSQTGRIIQEAILKIFSTSPHCRILVCSPTNKACDALMRSLDREIPRSDLFRANAAFRDYDLVPGDIIPQCLYEGECFKCPSLSDIKNFKVITSTFMSSFRLHTAGVNDNHFTHVFLVDACAAIEPEIVVPLANLVGENKTIVVSGSSTNSPSFVRSDIARRHGLKKSYFQRLLEREPYLSRDPMFITHIDQHKIIC